MPRTSSAPARVLYDYQNGEAPKVYAVCAIFRFISGSDEAAGKTIEQQAWSVADFYGLIEAPDADRALVEATAKLNLRADTWSPESAEAQRRILICPLEDLGNWSTFTQRTRPFYFPVKGGGLRQLTVNFI